MFVGLLVCLLVGWFGRSVGQSVGWLLAWFALLCFALLACLSSIVDLPGGPGTEVDKIAYMNKGKDFVFRLGEGRPLAREENAPTHSNAGFQPFAYSKVRMVSFSCASLVAVVMSLQSESWESGGKRNVHVFGVACSILLRVAR